MGYFADYYTKLSPYQEFNPKAFVGDDKAPQEVCNFVLALSLVYNDYKYYNISYDMLLKSEPEKLERNCACGECAGIKFHIIRLHAGFIHELLKLIERNKDTLEHPFFVEIVRLLSKKARDSWKIITEAALLGTSSAVKPNPIARIRHKITFHYDTGELFTGYINGFFENEKTLENACVSLGNNLKCVRFYFADRAVQGYLEKGLGVDVKNTLSDLGKIMREVNLSLYEICTKFIQRRGFAWEKPRQS